MGPRVGGVREGRWWGVVAGKCKTILMVQRGCDVGGAAYPVHYSQSQSACLLHCLVPCCLVPLLLQLADRLNRVAEGLQRSQPLSVLVQVNTSGEETKYGCEPDEVRHGAAACTQWQRRGRV